MYQSTYSEKYSALVYKIKIVIQKSKNLKIITIKNIKLSFLKKNVVRRVPKNLKKKVYTLRNN